MTGDGRERLIADLVDEIWPHPMGCPCPEDHRVDWAKARACKAILAALASPRGEPGVHECLTSDCDHSPSTVLIESGSHHNPLVVGNDAYAVIERVEVRLGRRLPTSVKIAFAQEIKATLAAPAPDEARRGGDHDR
jgi:hypothetical protein